MVRKLRRSTESPAHSSINAFRVALRVICVTAVQQLLHAAPSPNDHERLGLVMTVPLESRPVSVTDGGDDPRRPPSAIITPLPSSWFSNVRDVASSSRRLQTTSSRPKPTVRTNRPKKRNRKTKTKRPKNKRNRNGKKKKTVLKNKIIVKLEDRPKTEDSPSSSSSPPPTTMVRVSKIVMRETVPQCAAANGGRFIDVLGLVKSVEFHLAVTIVFVLLVVVFAIYRYWMSWTRRLKPFHVLI